MDDCSDLSEMTTRATGTEHIAAWQQIVSSCSGAIITSVFTTPLDVVKIRLQAQQKRHPGVVRSVAGVGGSGTTLMEYLCICSHCHNSVSGTVPRSTLRVSHPVPTVHFTGSLDAVLRIAQKEGVTTLWSGLSPTLVMAVPATVVYFTSYDQLKYALGYRESDSSTKYIPLLAGAIARVGAATLISPLELIRTKLQSEALTYRQLGNAIRLSVMSHGPLFMMRGLGPSLLRDVPFSAIYWFGYEMLKARHIRNNDNSNPTFMETFVTGALTGTIAAVLTSPFDVIKTFRQIELGQTDTSGGAQRVTSTWTLISDLYIRNGPTALYAGLFPRIVKIAPACAIMISIYEYGKSFFREQNAIKKRHIVTM